MNQDVLQQDECGFNVSPLQKSVSQSVSQSSQNCKQSDCVHAKAAKSENALKESPFSVCFPKERRKTVKSLPSLPFVGSKTTKVFPDHYII